MGFFCNHDWNKLADHMIEAPYDAIKSMDGKGGSIPVWFFQKTHIFIMACKACGKVYKSVERCP